MFFDPMANCSSSIFQIILDLDCLDSRVSSPQKMTSWAFHVNHTSWCRWRITLGVEGGRVNLTTKKKLGVLLSYARYRRRVLALTLSHKCQPTCAIEHRGNIFVTLRWGRGQSDQWASLPWSPLQGTGLSAASSRIERQKWSICDLTTLKLTWSLLWDDDGWTGGCVHRTGRCERLGVK